MGYKQSPGLIVIVAALLLLTPLAYGQVQNVADITARLCCTPTGECSPDSIFGSIGVSGVRASLKCISPTGELVTLGQSVTNSTGVVSFTDNNTVRLFALIVSGILPCGVFVNVPLFTSVDCPILSVSGLVGNLTLPVSISARINVRL